MGKQAYGNLTHLWDKSVPTGGLNYPHWEGLSRQGNKLDANKGLLPVSQVPDSMVVSAAAYRKFMITNRLDEVVEGLLENINITHLEQLQNVAAQIKEIIHNSPIPEPLYSSINAACQRLANGVATIVWPVTMLDGQFSTAKQSQKFPHLEARNPTELMGAIKTWWASLFDPAAIYFREIKRRSHRHAEITVAAKQVPHYKPGRPLSPYAATPMTW